MGVSQNKRLIAAVLAIAAAVVAVPAATSVAQTERVYRLDVIPETGTPTTGTSYTLTARLCALVDPPTDACVDQANTLFGSINVDFENEGGVNDDDGVTRNLPDRTCTIPTGMTSCSITYVGTNAGTDIWRAWIDEPNRVQTFPEADEAEGRDEATAPGTGDRCSLATSPGALVEPDCTDVVEVTWSRGFRALDCDDQSGDDRETNVQGQGGESQETYTCTLTNEQGQPMSNQTIRGENKGGANDPDPLRDEPGTSYSSPDYQCQTNAQGQCQMTVPSRGQTGTAQICFWHGTTAEGESRCSDEPTDEPENNDLADQVEKRWAERRPPAIDAEPETDVNGLGQMHTITVTVLNEFGEPAGQTTTVVNFEFFQGSPSDTDGNTPEIPDATCEPVDSDTCEFSYTSRTEGVDRICVWIGETPTMAGGNRNGTCDGESLEDPAGRADNQDVVEKRWEERPPTEAVTVDANPETDTNNVGETHTITATTLDENNQAPGQTTTVSFEFFEGSPSDNDGNTPESPDMTCETDETGECEATYTSDEPGRDLVCVYIGQMTSADMEGDNTNGTCDGTAFEDAGPDDEDVVEKNWQRTGPAPARLDCDDENGDDRATNPQGTGSASDETYTCSLTDAQGNAVSGQQINGENESGANDPDNSTSYGSPDYDCTTTQSGTCDVTVASTGQAGTAQICFWYGGQGQTRCADEQTDEQENNDLADQVEKTWQQQAAARVNAEPETDTNTVGQTHTITASVSDQFGGTPSGQTVNFEFFQGSPRDRDGNTPESPDATCRTDSSGRCDFGYTSNTAGTDLVCVWTGNMTNANMTGGSSGGSCDGETLGSEPATGGGDQDVVEKRWQQVFVQPPPTGTTTPTTPATTTTSPAQVPPTSFARQVTLEASKNVKRFGNLFALSGTITSEDANVPAGCLANVDVVIERQVVGTQSFVEVRRVKTDENGAFGTNISADRSASYVARVPTSSVGATAVCSEATSSPEVVRVRKAVTLRVSDRRIRPGQRVRFRVAVAPCEGHEGDRIQLRKAIQGRMARIAAQRGRATQDCVAVFRRRISRNNVFQGRSPTTDADHLGGTSTKKAVRVRRGGIRQLRNR